VPDPTVSVQIAFEGGQTVGANVTAKTADALVAALASSEPVFELEAEDGTYVLALAKVVYVRRSDRETRIGFAASA
jgi:hypothetical protein